jgi:hypothetical protein
VQSASWLQRRTRPVPPDGGNAQLSELAGGLSLQEDAHEAARPVAVHFGGRSFAASVTSVIFAQQMGAELGQSEAVKHARVVFAGQAVALLHAFVCAGRVAQHTWFALHLIRLVSVPQLASITGPASITGAGESGPASLGGDATSCASTGGAVQVSAPVSPGLLASSGWPMVASVPGSGVSTGGALTSSPGGGVDESDSVVGLFDVLPHVSHSL